MTTILRDMGFGDEADERLRPSMLAIGGLAMPLLDRPRWCLAAAGVRLGEMIITPGDIVVHHAPAGWLCLAVAKSRTFEAFCVDRGEIWRVDDVHFIAWRGPERLFFDADAPSSAALVEVRLGDLPDEGRAVLAAAAPLTGRADAAARAGLMRIVDNAAAIERVLTRAALPAARHAVQETVVAHVATLLSRAA